MKKIISLCFVFALVQILSAQTFLPIKSVDDILGSWEGEFTLDASESSTLLGLDIDDMPPEYATIKFELKIILNLEFVELSDGKILSKMKMMEGITCSDKKKLPNELKEMLLSIATVDVSKDGKKITAILDDAETNTDISDKSDLLEELDLLSISTDKKSMMFDIDEMKFLLKRK